MGAQAESTFAVGSWDESTYDELDSGAKLARARITSDYSGDLEGSGTWEVLMCYGDDGTATYIGLERVIGRIGGRSGSFVVETRGGYDGNEARWTSSVVPGSGTGELGSLRGEGTSVAPHGPNGKFTLEYELA